MSERKYPLLFFFIYMFIGSLIINFILVSMLTGHRRICQTPIRLWAKAKSETPAHETPSDKQASTTHKNKIVPESAASDAVQNTTTPGESPNGEVLIKGVDVAHYQGHIQWDKVKQEGRLFSYFKATEGTSMIDTTFVRHWRHSGQGNMIRGAYHFFYPDSDPVRQANHFIKMVKPYLDDNSMPPFIDVETRPEKTTSKEAFAQNVLSWIKTVEKGLQRRVMIYTNEYIGNTYLSGTEFSKYPLFIAYPDLRGPLNPRQARIPKAWKKFTFWQYTQTPDIEGIVGRVDHDVFNGTEQDLLVFIKNTHLSTN